MLNAMQYEEIVTNGRLPGLVLHTIHCGGTITDHHVPTYPHSVQ